MALANYQTNLTWIAQAYGLLLKDFQQRRDGLATTLTLDQTSDVAKNFTAVGHRLTKIYDSLRKESSDAPLPLPMPLAAPIEAPTAAPTGPLSIIPENALLPRSPGRASILPPLAPARAPLPQPSTAVFVPAVAAAAPAAFIPVAAAAAAAPAAPAPQTLQTQCVNPAMLTNPLGAAAVFNQDQMRLDAQNKMATDVAGKIRSAEINYNTAKRLADIASRSQNDIATAATAGIVYPAGTAERAAQGVATAQARLDNIEAELRARQDEKAIIDKVYIPLQAPEIVQQVDPPRFANDVRVAMFRIDPRTCQPSVNQFLSLRVSGQSADGRTVRLTDKITSRELQWAGNGIWVQDYAVPYRLLVHPFQG